MLGIPVIVVSGPPASGKTHVAARLSDELGLPVIAKDAFKETLFDALGVGDVAWSQRLGLAAIELLYCALESQLRAGQPALVEANFDVRYARERFAELHRTYGFEPLEIHCTADPDVLLARYVERGSTRHLGHVDSARVREVEACVRDGTNGALRLGGELLVVDTTDLAAVDLGSVSVAANTHLKRSTKPPSGGPEATTPGARAGTRRSCDRPRGGRQRPACNRDPGRPAWAAS